MYWLIGLITAFMTSFYMFRLWFMTFFGEYRRATRSPITTAHATHRTAHGDTAWRSARESDDHDHSADHSGAFFLSWRMDWDPGNGFEHFLSIRSFTQRSGAKVTEATAERSRRARAPNAC